MCTGYCDCQQSRDTSAIGATARGNGVNHTRSPDIDMAARADAAEIDQGARPQQAPWHGRAGVVRIRRGKLARMVEATAGRETLAADLVITELLSFRLHRVVNAFERSAALLFRREFDVSLG